MNESRTHTVWQMLRTAIITGELAPDEKLNIEKLKSQYQVGATPIREALNQLDAEGLVRQEPSRGFWVSPISTAELKDLYSLRLMLEQQALALSIENGDDAWEADVISAHHYLAKLESDPNFWKKPDLMEWSRRYQRYHLSLLGACGSPWMIKIINMLFMQTARYRYAHMVKGVDIATTLQKKADKHQQLTDAIIKRDVKQAQRLLASCLTSTIDMLTIL